MTSTTIKNEIRTGIYVQESAGVTTVGDGLAPRGDKSPVADTQTNKTEPGSCPSDDVSINDLTRGVCEMRPSKIEYRNNLMKYELYRLGFRRPDLELMKGALDKARRQFFHSNKIKQHCEEKQVDPQTLKNMWMERKERELAKYRAEKAQKIAAGTFDPLSFRERKALDRERREAEKAKTLNRNEEVRRSPAFADKAKILNRNEEAASRRSPKRTQTFLEDKKTQLDSDSNAFKIKIAIYDDHNLTSEQILKIIKKQNDLPTERWTLVRQKRYLNKIKLFKAYYDIDKLSLKKLHRHENKIYYLFKRIPVIVCVTNDAERIKEALAEDSICEN